MKTIKFMSLFLLGTMTLAACKKEGCIDPNAINYNPEAEKSDSSCEYEVEGAATLEFSHDWGTSGTAFSLNTPLSHPMNGDDLNFTKLKYYVSNVALKSTDGTWWEHPESYFLIDVSDPTTLQLAISGIPEGGYTDLRYVLGVDSTRNVSGAQTGALSTANGMFWSWNTGYIMVKAEGTSSNSASGTFSYHLGGFSGSENIVTTKEHAFGTTLNITGTGSPAIKLSSNVARLFHYYGSVSNGETVHMPGSAAVTLSNGFYEGFSFVEIVQ